MNESIMCNFQSEITKPFFVVLEKPRDWLTDYFLKDWAMIPYSLAASFLHDVSSSKAQNEAYHLRYQIRQALYLQGGLLAYCRTWSTIFQNGSYYVLLHVVEHCTFIFFLRNKEFTFRRERGKIKSTQIVLVCFLFLGWPMT